MGEGVGARPAGPTPLPLPTLPQAPAACCPSRDTEGLSQPGACLHSVWNLNCNFPLFQQILCLCRTELFSHLSGAQKEKEHSPTSHRVKEKPLPPSNWLLFGDQPLPQKGIHPLPRIQLTLCETGQGLRRLAQAPFRAFRGGLWQGVLANKGCQTK